MITLLVFSIPVWAQETAEIIQSTTDYTSVFVSLATLVAVIPVILEALKGFYPKMPVLLSVILSWVIGVAIALFGWWMELGFLAGEEWYIALLYGLGSGLAANGLAATGLVQWIITLFASKIKKKKA